MTDRPRPPRALRERVFARSDGRCQHCGQEITLETFHVSHLRAHAHGGTLHESNLEAWCQRCNLTQGSQDAGDPRVAARDWQIRALPIVMQAIGMTGTATVSAAPAAGKTIFTGLTFRELHNADLVDRLVVVVPRVALVQQWIESLNRNLQIELKPNSAIERRGQDGVVVTYQSLLNEDQRDAHISQARHMRTLVALDECHHGGEREDGKLAWSHSLAQLVGELGDLNVAAVLNLSGTLWRTDPSQRIPTVRYRQEPDGKIVSLVDFRVDAEELIARQELRPLDLYRLGTQVSVADWTEFEYIEGLIADLSEPAARAATRGLPGMDAWLEAFVSAVLDRLELAYRALNRYHVKALVVAARQEDARRFHAEVNRQQIARGLPRLAELAISNDGEDARRALESFRTQKKVGVLCTVDMAGEGYDCPDIAVVGYASNKSTPLYMRQVAARAMRVTDREREMGNVIPAQIVMPDVPFLVEKLTGYLGPYVQDLTVPPERLVTGPTDGNGDGPLPLQMQRFGLEKANLTDQETVTIALPDGSTEHVDGVIARALAKQIEELYIPAIWAPRIEIALRRASGGITEESPFDPIPSPIRQPASTEQKAIILQTQLQKLAGWVAVHGDMPVENFNRLVNQAGDIGKGGRPTASVEQLERSLAFAKQTVREIAKRTGKQTPGSAL